MATTTNYGWVTPDDTDLVKDGAAAIRTLGSSADTSVKALSPGTTAGDIDYYTTSTAKARVGIGTAGQLLRVNSGATAPEWATISTGGMTLLNSGGTTLTGASVTISSIPATFNDLRIIVRNFVPATDNTPLQMRFNADANANRHIGITTISSNTSSFNATSVAITAASDNAANSGASASTIYDYANTATFKICQTHTSAVPNDTAPANIRIAILQGFYNQLTAISSLEFFPNSGNFTSGTVFVYGVK